MTPARGYRPIGDYAIIGDEHTAALVASDGSIDWCCCPRFDSPALFCRLLEVERGGYYRVGPVAPYTSSRSYVGWTNVLATTFTTDTGRLRITDLMPVPQRKESRQGEDIAASHRVLRLVEGVAGTVECEVRFRPTFNFATEPTLVQPCEGGAVARAREESRVLACSIPLHNNISASWRESGPDAAWPCRDQSPRPKHLAGNAESSVPCRLRRGDAKFR
jgi:GH15 family glucan-1,4-alpha-glucosidase